jgi:hypothetical protein
MKRSMITTALPLVAVALVSTATTAFASSTLSGNPLSDGWMKVGNSLATGAWIDDALTTPADGFNTTGYDADFDVYRTQYVSNGDTYLGLGGVVVGPSDLEAVIKFGTTSAIYQAASSVGASDGVGGDAAGGDGMILTRLSAVASNPESLYRVTDSATTYTSIIDDAAGLLTCAVNLAPQTYVVNWGGYNTGTANYLTSFEAVLDLTAVEKEFPGYTFATNDLCEIAMQANQPGDYSYNDALVGAVPVPLPAAAGPGLGVLVGAGIVVGLKRHRKLSCC